MCCLPRLNVKGLDRFLINDSSENLGYKIFEQYSVRDNFIVIKDLITFQNS